MSSRNEASIGRLLAGACVLALALAPAEAHADLSACGNIGLEPDPECRVLVIRRGCVDNCTATFFEAACAAQLHQRCYGECVAPVDASCLDECPAACESGCDFAPGLTDCGPTCRGRCRLRCAEICDAGDGRCQAACAATCGVFCDGSCDAVAPDADCTMLCDAVCNGVCQADATLDCHVACQDEHFFACADTMRLDCIDQCHRAEGALFCDGQYVDNIGDLDECIGALEREYGVELEEYRNPDDTPRPEPCDDGACATAGMAPSAWASAALGLLLLVTARRRR